MPSTTSDVNLSLTAVNEYLTMRCSPSLPLTQDICQHILSKSGKQMRAQVVLLAAQTGSLEQPEHAITLAAIIELIHNATLLHDDVIDHAEQRRFQTTAHLVWDNTSAILAGDYLYGLAFDMMTELGIMPILSHLAQATQTIVQGEMEQHAQKHHLDTKIDDYMHMIGAKTATLFAVASHTAALLAHNDETMQKALQAFGYQLGLAFQIKDDLLDYAPNQQTGKPCGQDLQEGKITLPLMLAYQAGNLEQRDNLKAALGQADDHTLSTVATILDETQAFIHCKQRLERIINQAIQALEPLPESDAKKALIEMANYTAFRDH